MHIFIHDETTQKIEDEDRRPNDDHTCVICSPLTPRIEGETMDDGLSWDGDKFSSWPPSPIMPAASSMETAAQGPPSWAPSPVIPAASSMETAAQGLATAIGKTRSNRDVCMHFLLVEEARL